MATASKVRAFQREKGLPLYYTKVKVTKNGSHGGQRLWKLGGLLWSIGPIWDMGWDSSGMGWNTGLDLTRSIKTESFGVLVRFLTLGRCLVMLPFFLFFMFV